MKPIIVNSGREDALANIQKVEEKYKASFVGQFCLKTKHGGWSENPADVYYQEVVPIEGYSHYFGLIIQQGSLYIVSGQSAIDEPFSGIIADDGEIIYSRYRYDYRTSKDGSVWIDGGKDYTKGPISDKFISIIVVDGKFYKV